MAYSVTMDANSTRTKGVALERIGGQPAVSNTVCKYWLAGRCNRYPCRFLHSESQPKQCQRGSNFKSKMTWRNPDYARNSSNHGAVRPEYKRNEVMISKFEDPDNANSASKLGALSSECERKSAVTSRYEEPEVIMEILTEGSESGKNIQNAQSKLCEYWVAGNCVHGVKCKDLHTWFYGSGFSLLAKLEGHKKAITGITLPTGFDKLLTASKGESVRLWDCHSGQCVHTVELSGDIGCLISEGLWVFVGLQNAVKAWNFMSQSELILHGPNGVVHALAVDDNVLFAGVQDGSILAWKTNLVSNHIELAVTLKGHSSAVISLVVGRHRLYSGSEDETIRVWDVNTLQCLQTINGHNNFVTSLLCWDNYLLSGSLDNTLKVWAATESGSLEVVYVAKEEYGILALSGMKDSEGKPILFCSCKDNVVRLYELPTFSERGRIFSNAEIQTVETGIDGLFFTGDAKGKLSVWKFS